MGIYAELRKQTPEVTGSLVRMRQETFNLLTDLLFASGCAGQIYRHSRRLRPLDPFWMVVCDFCTPARFLQLLVHTFECVPHRAHSHG